MTIKNLEFSFQLTKAAPQETRRLMIIQNPVEYPQPEAKIDHPPRDERQAPYWNKQEAGPDKGSAWLLTVCASSLF